MPKTISHSTESYPYYFYFIQERMNIFWKRYNSIDGKLTDDNIFAEYKFTNVYRVLDRVSQYLIREVINNNETFNEVDTLLRIIVFKVFNKIETWEYIRQEIGELKVDNFDPALISKLLKNRIINGPIFSAAYMMTGSHQKYNNYESKHEKWLMMINRELLKEGRLAKIATASGLNEVFNILSECSFIGGFLAYQYAIDMNYSDVIDFDEDSFVKAGIGSIRGIKKCFIGNNFKTPEHFIYFTQENFEKFQNEFGFTSFQNLFGRPLKLIDLQNCFCETDKYLRAKLPHLLVDNTRIKQKFSKLKEPIQYVFPRKWKLNQTDQPCNTKYSTELTLF